MTQICRITPGWKCGVSSLFPLLFRTSKIIKKNTKVRDQLQISWDSNILLLSLILLSDSEIEKNDIKKAYLNGKGCINYMMNCVPFMAVEDEPRIIDMVKGMTSCTEFLKQLTKFEFLTF